MTTTLTKILKEKIAELKKELNEIEEHRSFKNLDVFSLQIMQRRSTVIEFITELNATLENHENGVNDDADYAVYYTKQYFRLLIQKGKKEFIAGSHEYKNSANLALFRGLYDLFYRALDDEHKAAIKLLGFK